MAASNRRIPLRILPWLVALPLAALPTALAAKSPKGDEPAIYKVKRGDTLIELAEKYLRKRSDYRTVQRINRIRDPRKISIGKRLSIPFRLLRYRPSEASVSSFRGKVSIAHAGRNLAAAKGLDVSEGTRLVTSAGGFLTLRLEDGSRISMPSNSNVRITRLRHILLTDSVDYEFAVDSGRVRSKIKPFDKKQDRYRVRTPVAVSAVRGTDYRTRVDEASGTAYSETVEGEVEVAAGSANVSVPAGTGAAATVSGELAKVDLLSPPQLTDPAKVQSEEQLQFEIANREEAVAHQIQISTDAGFVDVVAANYGQGTSFALEGLPDGRYFAKATAFSQEGFEGMPASYSFKRQLSTLSGSAGAGDFGYRFKWDGSGKGKRIYRFQLLRGSKTAIPMVDETGLTKKVLTLSDLPRGEYFWRVGVTQFSDDKEDSEALQKWTDFEKLTVAG